MIDDIKPFETIRQQTIREYGTITIANIVECAERRESALLALHDTAQQTIEELTAEVEGVTSEKEDAEREVELCRRLLAEHNHKYY